MAKTKQHKFLRGTLREKKYVEVSEEDERYAPNQVLGRREVLAILSTTSNNKVEDNESSSSSGDENSISSFLPVRSRKCKRKKVRSESPNHQDTRRLTSKRGSIAITSGGFYAALSNHITSSKKGKKSQKHVVIDRIIQSSQAHNGSGLSSDDGVAQMVTSRLTEPATVFVQVLKVGSLSIMEDVIGTLHDGDGGFDQLQPTVQSDGDSVWTHDEKDSCQLGVDRKKGTKIAMSSSSSSSSPSDSNKEHIVRALYHALYKSSASVKPTYTSYSSPNLSPNLSPSPGVVVEVGVKPSNNLPLRRPRAVSIDDSDDDRHQSIDNMIYIDKDIHSTLSVTQKNPLFRSTSAFEEVGVESVDSSMDVMFRRPRSVKMYKDEMPTEGMAVASRLVSSGSILQQQQQQQQQPSLPSLHYHHHHHHNLSTNDEDILHQAWDMTTRFERAREIASAPVDKMWFHRLIMTKLLLSSPSTTAAETRASPGLSTGTRVRPVLRSSHNDILDIPMADRDRDVSRPWMIMKNQSNVSDKGAMMRERSRSMGHGFVGLPRGAPSFEAFLQHLPGIVTSIATTTTTTTPTISTAAASTTTPSTTATTTTTKTTATVGPPKIAPNRNVEFPSQIITTAISETESLPPPPLDSDIIALHMTPAFINNVAQELSKEDERFSSPRVSLLISLFHHCNNHHQQNHHTTDEDYLRLIIVRALLSATEARLERRTYAQAYVLKHLNGGNTNNHYSSHNSNGHRGWGGDSSSLASKSIVSEESSDASCFEMDIDQSSMTSTTMDITGDSIARDSISIGNGHISEVFRDHDVAMIEALMAVIGYLLRDLVVMAKTWQSSSSLSSSSSSSSSSPSVSSIRLSSSTPPPIPPHLPSYHIAFIASQQRICGILHQAVFNVLKCYSINCYTQELVVFRVLQVPSFSSISDEPLVTLLSHVGISSIQREEWLDSPHDINSTTLDAHGDDSGGICGDSGDEETSNAYISCGESSSTSPLIFSRRNPYLRALLDRILFKLILTPGQGLQSLHSKVACACVELLSNSHVLQTMILYQPYPQSNLQSNLQSNAQSNSQSNIPHATVDTKRNSHELLPLSHAPMLWHHHRWSNGWRERLIQALQHNRLHHWHPTVQASSMHLLHVLHHSSSPSSLDSSSQQSYDH